MKLAMELDLEKQPMDLDREDRQQSSEKLLSGLLLQCGALNSFGGKTSGELLQELLVASGTVKRIANVDDYVVELRKMFIVEAL